MQIITGLRLRRDQKGVSNIIVVVLSLIIIVAIVANVVLWGYQMNQSDWEKTREKVEISDVSFVNVTLSPWFVAQSEYEVNVGSRIGGTYIDTQVANDGNWETFQEETRPPTHRLDSNGTFVLNIFSFPLDSISTIEIELRYRASDNLENWFLEAYNWRTKTYSDSGFNVTTGHTPTRGWDTYVVSLTDVWTSYVLNDGTVYVKLHEEGEDALQTTVDVDFLGVRAVVGGILFSFKNKGSVTSHLVSLWVNNSTYHLRYDINVFVNSGETVLYQRADINLPNGQYMVKVVTERGNVEVYSEN